MTRSVRFLSVIAFIAAMLGFAGPGAPSAAAATGDLLISEYVEGSSNNKALEVYNGTGADVDLAAGNYSLALYSNGNTTAGSTLTLTGTLADGDVLVVANSSAGPDIQAVTDVFSGVANFNGDDAVELRANGVTVDSFGQIGFDPGSQWPGGGQNDTLIRNADVCAGDTVTSDAFDASLQWQVLAIDTFSELGSHSANCDGEPPIVGDPLPLTEGFDDCALVGWQIISLDTDTANTWECSAGFSNISASSFGNAAAADEWLITPPIDFDAQTGDTLSFRSYTNFVDVAYPQLEVLYSSDYDGIDVTTATWTALNALTLSPEDSGTYTSSGPIDLSAINGRGVYFAFNYTSSGVVSGESATWRLDDIAFTGDGGPGSDCETPVTDIGAIQGSGSSAAITGPVVVRGVVVGDFEGDSPALRGFYVQDEGDGDPATSDALFVFNGGADEVALGDVVTVDGNAGEFQDQTQISASAVTVCDDLVMTVEPTVITLPVATPDGLEPFEAMLVELPQPLYVTEHFQLGRFGQVVVSSDSRLAQPTNVTTPGAAANALQASNDLRRLIIDDNTNAQNPDTVEFGRDGSPLSAVNTLRGGDTVTGAVGVLTYTWAGNAASGNAYRLRPLASLGGQVEFVASNERPSARPEVGGSLNVASFNVLNYFVSLGNVCGPNQDLECRGADDNEEFLRQRAKLLPALVELDADIVGLVEIENTTGVSGEADIVSGLNDLLGAGTYDYIDAGVVGTDAIRVGLIYKPATVTPSGAHQILDFSNDDLGAPRSRSALAQSFTENATGETVSVVVNHFKSKGSSGIDDDCDADPGYSANCDQGDGQGYFSAVRTTHAQEMIDWLASDPTNVNDDDWLILGDLNAYAMEDPIAILTDAGYTNLVSEFEGPDAYSYVFDGQWGYLDYALASPSLMSQVTGTDTYHINADEPSVLDYNTNFQSPEQVALWFAPDEFRTSDHDPVLVGLALAPVEPPEPSPCDFFADYDVNVIEGTPGDDLLIGTDGVDLINGRGGDDILIGAEAGDIICGGSGDDLIVGGDGADLLLGGEGADIIAGQAGDDWMGGQEGDDYLAGQDGDDLMAGGVDNDILVGSVGSDEARGGSGTDSCSAETTRRCEAVAVAEAKLL